MDDRNHSTLEPALGSSAADIAGLGSAMYVGGAAIFALVLALVLYAAFAKEASISTRRWLFGGGLAFPVAVLCALLGYSIVIGSGLHTHADTPIRIHVVGKKWWWQVRYDIHSSYLAFAANQSIVLANEIHIPIGVPVEITLSSDDVIHSFWTPSLAGKVDMIPGRTNVLRLRTNEAGVYRGQCAEYCGLQHALMAFHVIAEPETQFKEWLNAQAAPVKSQHVNSNAGWRLFVRAGCAECHAVRGTDANGVMGPDLTHIGSRHSLAAGILGNHVGTLAGWIAASQDIKPGNAMPTTRTLTGEELRTLASWLAHLK